MKSQRERTSDHSSKRERKSERRKEREGESDQKEWKDIAYMQTLVTHTPSFPYIHHDEVAFEH